jgi:hypothetical protein
MQKYVIALYIRLSIEDYKYDSSPFVVKMQRGLDITQESVGDKCSVLSRRSCPTSFIFRCRI